ncbi:MAG: nitrous oxide reductase accessory protein NosL [Deltaproteobacteria bacterium]|nr:nitrous oxide reductase accessory protein NosL [Deltaproteobacteria bacterium]
MVKVTPPQGMRRRASTLRMLGFLCAMLCLLTAESAQALDPAPVVPSKEVKCPVCGMFVYKYPDWVGEVIFQDGSVAFFDGAKDLFKYYFDLKKYNPAKTQEDVAAIYVTEYYDLKLIDARKSFFVMGSDVYGPMGRELIPFLTKTDAEEFKRDHKGTRILLFQEVTPAVIRNLDE